MEKSLLNLCASDKDIGKIIESMENRSLLDEVSPKELLGIAMDIYISGNGGEIAKTTAVAKKSDTKALPKIQDLKAAPKKIKKVLKPADKKEEMPQATEVVPPKETKPAPEVKKSDDSASKVVETKSSATAEKIPAVKPISVIPKTFDKKTVSYLKKSVELKKISPIAKIAVKSSTSAAPKTIETKTVPSVKKPDTAPVTSPAVSSTVSKPVEAEKAEKPIVAAKPVKTEKEEKTVVAVKPVEVAKVEKRAIESKPVEVEKAKKPVVAEKSTIAGKPVEAVKAEKPPATVKPVEAGKTNGVVTVSEPVKTRTVKRIKKIIRKIKPATKDGQPRTIVEETIIETIPHIVEEKPKISEPKVVATVAAPSVPAATVEPVIPEESVAPVAPAVTEVPETLPAPETEKTADPPAQTDDDLVSFALGLFSSSAEEEKVETVDEENAVSVSAEESPINPAPPIFDETGAFQPAPADMDLLDALMNPSAPIFNAETEKTVPATSGGTETQWASDTISPIEEMLAAAGMFTEEEDPPKQLEKTRMGADSLTASPVQKSAEKTSEEHFLSPDDWMSIIDGKTPPPTVEATPAVSPAIEKAVPVPTPKLAKQEAGAADFVSPDDWMDMMEGKEAGSGVVTAEEAAAIELGYALKDAPDYAAKHELPERQELKIKEKTPTRDGMRKKEMFYQTKVSFKSRFGSSTKKPGKICSSCGKGEKANACVSCGNSEATYMTRVCDKCAGDKKVYNKCISCGRPNAKIIGRLCENCRSMSRSCVICGKKL